MAIQDTLFSRPVIVAPLPCAPLPCYVPRATLRSSPLAGPAMAITRPSISDDDTQDSERTRTGATPSRISALYPSPPSSLRSVNRSRTPSPSRSTSESHQSSISSATSHSFPPSPPLTPTCSTAGGGVSTPSARPHSKPHPRPLPRARVHASSLAPSAGGVPPLPSSRPPTRSHTKQPLSHIHVPAPFEYPASAAPFSNSRPNTSQDPTRNWLTTTAPPPFSRSHVKGVVMPMRASGRRPQTAPATPHARGLGFGDAARAETAPPRRQVHHHMENIMLLERRRSEYASTTRLSYRQGDAAHLDILSGRIGVPRKHRRPRSMMTLPVRSTLGEVREEQEQEREGEGECEGKGEGEGEGSESESSKADVRHVQETLAFPVLAVSAAQHVPGANNNNATGWIRRRWTRSLKLIKEQFGRTTG